MQASASWLCGYFVRRPFGQRQQQQQQQRRKDTRVNRGSRSEVRAKVGEGSDQVRDAQRPAPCCVAVCALRARSCHVVRAPVIEVRAPVIEMRVRAVSVVYRRIPPFRGGSRQAITRIVCSDTACRNAKPLMRRIIHGLIPVTYAPRVCYHSCTYTGRRKPQKSMD